MKGTHKQRCFNIRYGLESDGYDTFSIPNEVQYCKVSEKCVIMNGVGWFCGKQLESAKWNTENFDNIFYAFINVY